MEFNCGAMKLFLWCFSVFVIFVLLRVGQEPVNGASTSIPNSMDDVIAKLTALPEEIRSLEADTPLTLDGDGFKEHKNDWESITSSHDEWNKLKFAKVHEGFEQNLNLMKKHIDDCTFQRKLLLETLESKLPKGS